MIASALDEMLNSATTNFPSQLTAVMAKRGVTLMLPVAVQRWFGYETDELRSALVATPSAMMSVRWTGDGESQTARPSAGIRDSRMRFTVAYLFKTTDIAVAETHIKYVPEALALWLDTFPIASRVPGSVTTITKIAPPLGQKIVMRQKKESVRISDNGTSPMTTYEWNVEAEFDVEIRDPVPGGVPVASIAVSPTSATIIAKQTQQLTVTVKDAALNVLTGRNVYFQNVDDSLATVNGAGLVTGRGPSGGSASSSVIAMCEGHFASCALTLLPAVASVIVTPSPFLLSVGGTRQLAVVLKDASGNVLTGRPITYQSATPSLAAVDVNGLVTGVAVGAASILVTSEGVTATVAGTVMSVYSITTLPMAWWKRDTITGLANGAPVTAWADSSGNGLALATDVSSPIWETSVLGGSVNFASVGGGLKTSALSFLNGTAGFTMFLVAKFANLTGGSMLGAPSFGAASMYLYASALYHYLGAANNGSYAFSDTASGHVFEQIFDGSQVGNAARLIALLDGTQESLAFAGTIPASTGVVANGYEVGHVDTSQAQTYQAEVLIYNVALNASDRSTVRHALGTKYGLTVV